MSDSRNEFESLVGPGESLRVMESLKRGASRRDVLKMLLAGGMQATLAGSLAGAAVTAYAQTPRRGGGGRGGGG
ncbi:ABC transporter substrate-binding protein, partial [Ralstonia solanacearum]|nr:ABC transporter substrate-binding protein [Ralstonia solanacearum]